MPTRSWMYNPLEGERWTNCGFSTKLRNQKDEGWERWDVERSMRHVRWILFFKVWCIFLVASCDPLQSYLRSARSASLSLQIYHSYSQGFRLTYTSNVWGIKSIHYMCYSLYSNMISESLTSESPMWSGYPGHGREDSDSEEALACFIDPPSYCPLVQPYSARGHPSPDNYP